MACSHTTLPSSASKTFVANLFDIKTCIDGALALLREMQVMAKTMAVAMETKRTTPPDARPPSPRSNGASVIALVAALHGGSHDPSLRASRWRPPFRKLLIGEKTLVSIIPSGK
jgi:hypothetical protein